jgi:CHAT domain-containing protein
MPPEEENRQSKNEKKAGEGGTVLAKVEHGGSDQAVEDTSHLEVATNVDATQEPTEEDEAFINSLGDVIDKPDAEAVQNQRLIDSTDATTPLEVAQRDTIKRMELQVARLVNEVHKLKGFISKRKQNYKRKRKDEGAPRRALSAYNVFIKDRFKRLASENMKALESDDTNAVLKRVPPASLVAATGNEWRTLPQEEKDKYEKM